MKIILIFLIFSIFILAEFLYFKKVSADVTRKIVHIGVGALISIFPYYFNFNEIILLGFLTSAIILFFQKNNLLKSIFAVKRKTIGARIYVPSLIILMILSWKEPIIFTMIVLITTVSDGFAGLLGKKFGKIKYENKTLLGSTIFFIFTQSILSYFIFKFNFLDFNLINLFKLTIISAVLTFIELKSSNGWDNFTIPIFSYFMIYFLIW